jgi:hypothetical protein
VLNGGYVHWLFHDSKEEPGSSLRGWQRRRDKRRQANRLLQGSVELSEMHVHARELRTQLAGLRLPDRHTA